LHPNIREELERVRCWLVAHWRKGQAKASSGRSKQAAPRLQKPAQYIIRVFFFQKEGSRNIFSDHLKDRHIQLYSSFSEPSQLSFNHTTQILQSVTPFASTSQTKKLPSYIHSGPDRNWIETVLRNQVNFLLYHQLSAPTLVGSLAGAGLRCNPRLRREHGTSIYSSQ